MRAISILALSNDAIRAAVIADPYSTHPTIKHFRVFPLPNGTVVDGEVVDETTMKGLLETLVRRFKYPREDTALLYSSRRMVFREADFPYMALDDLRATLPFQAKSMIPLPTDESVLDFVPLSLEEGDQGQMLHGLIVATLRAGLEKTARIIEDSGFVVTSIDAAPFALSRLFGDPNQEKLEAVVNVGGNSTDVIVLDHGKPAYLRVVPSGTDDLTDAVASALNISFEDAEQIKQRLGLQNVVGDERLEKAEEVIRETVAQLIVGIRNTLNYYGADHEGSIEGIILTGVGSQLEGFPSVLASSTGKVVRIGDPFEKFKLTREVRKQDIMMHATDMAAMLGLVIGKRAR